jgi:5-methylthioadenosine/S-adenosylhomocysteine deaminase
VGSLARESGAWIHTHIAETRDEVQLTREVFGRNPVQLYEALGYLEGKFLGAHAVHLTEAEKLILAAHRNAVLTHCPSANLKLGSGIAPLSDLLARGIRVGLGADGAACNNNLNIIEEMRLAGLLQKVSRGAATLSAETLLELATIDAARAIGLEEELGSIEPGKLADLTFFDLNHPSIQPAGTPAQQLVWSASSRDLVHTLVEGEFLVRDRRATRLDHDEVVKTARVEARKLVSRAGLEGKVRV